MPSARKVASLLVAAALLLAHFCSGQTWSTGYFNSADGFGPNNSSLDGAPTNAPANQQWQTTDPFVVAPLPNTDPNVGTGSTSQMQFTEGWTFGLSASGNKSVLFGGYGANGGVLPGISNPVLYRQFDHTFGSAATTFSIDFGIIANPTVSFTNKDVFGFNLAATNGTSLAAFELTSVGAPAGFLNIKWVQNGTNVVPNGTTFDQFAIEYGSLYRLTATFLSNTVNMEVAGLTAQNGGPGIGITNYAPESPVSVVSGGEISAGLVSSDFEIAALTWDLASGNNLDPGSNYMLINTVSVVPEPSTLALVAAASAALGLCRLRQRHR